MIFDGVFWGLVFGNSEELGAVSWKVEVLGWDGTFKFRMDCYSTLVIISDPWRIGSSSTNSRDKNAMFRDDGKWEF
jgi:hypothetical protein